MMEEQALCRIHRLGQRKDVKTIRYRMRGSFEEVKLPGSISVSDRRLMSENYRKWLLRKISRKKLRQMHLVVLGVMQ
jgi:SNF2 family DNA or RNA helicase